MILGKQTDPFFEFNVVIVRDAEDGVAFMKKEGAEGFGLRPDAPVTQNERYFRFGAYNVNAEKLRLLSLLPYYL